MEQFVPDKSSSAMHTNGHKPHPASKGILAYVDYYSIDDLLSEEERSIRDRVRRFCDQEVLPVAAEYWERAEVPFELVKKLAALNIAGGTIKGYGCPGLSPVAMGLAVAELTRGDGSLNTTFGVHSGLAMATIARFGSQEQKNQWLPALARMEKIGAFAMTEPEHGSDVVSFETSVSRNGDYWVINGAKKWIGNGSFADVVVVWARHKTGQIGAFLVEKGTPGFNAQVITGKVSQRASWQTHISLENVRVPISYRLANANSFGDFTTILVDSRCWVAWTALGHAIACYEHALAYVKKRNQFGKPIAHFQLVQQKLARMLAEITCLQLLCLRVSQLMAAKKLTVGMASLAKMQTAYGARRIAADARDLLGGNGILLENHVAKHQADLEAIFTLEGTDHMQSLIIGREITGTQAFA
ncbi:MAG TPA: acyl-CoA dehydrogenase family protein [Ktedonobacteraceae bacterium]|nr:acyl-CoA dehydrogenase family protein [Ktedonobacteraceae bacterium]